MVQALANREQDVIDFAPHSAAHEQLKGLMRLRRKSAATRDMALAFQYKCYLEEWQAYLAGMVARLFWLAWHTWACALRAAVLMPHHRPAVTTIAQQHRAWFL